MRRRRQAASRSPTRSSACWRLRGPGRSFLRTSRSTLTGSLRAFSCGAHSSSRVAVGLVAATSASAALTPIHRDTAKQRSRGFAPGRSRSRPRTRGLARVIVRLAAAAARRLGLRSTHSAAPRARPDSTSTPRRRARISHTSRRSRPPPPPRCAPRSRRRGSRSTTAIVLDGFAVELPARSLARLARALPAVNRVYPSLTYTRTMDRGPSVIHAPELPGRDRRQGPGDEDRRRRHGRRLVEPVPRARRLRVSRRASRRATSEHTTPKVIVARVFPGPVRDKLSNQAFDPTEPHGTHVSASPRATRARARRPAPTIRRRRTSQASRRAPGSATTASSRSRRRSGTKPTRRRSSARSSRRSPTA